MPIHQLEQLKQAREQAHLQMKKVQNTMDCSQ